MKEDKLGILSTQRDIAKKIDILIEAFVDFYGEERRDEIEQCFHSLLIIKFTCGMTIQNKVMAEKEKFFKKVYGDKIEPWYIKTLLDFIRKKDASSYRSLPAKVKEIIFGDSNKTAEEVLQAFAEGKYPKLNEFLGYYQDIAFYDDLMDKDNDNTTKIRNKYYNILISEFSYLIPAEEMKEYQQKGRVGPVMRSYFDTSITCLNQCFDDDAENLLNDPQKPQYRKDSVIKERLKFLRTHGYQFATYEEALRDHECVKFIKSTREICRKISARRKELYIMQTREIVECYDDYKKCRKIIDEKNFFNKNDSLGPFVYSTLGLSCFDDNYIFDGQKFVLSPIVLINAEADDGMIIHELNHALECTPLHVDENGCTVIDGWDYAAYKFNLPKDKQATKYTGITRKYELLNEYVNERLAQEITQMMHDKGVHIVDKVDDDKPQYMIMYFLLEDFYQEFKNIIIESRSHGNINYLFDNIGRDNFEALNALVNDYYHEYGWSSKAASAIRDYQNNNPSEDAKKIKEYVTKMHHILTNMQSYYSAHKTRK